jgi:hypothetical protein
LKEEVLHFQIPPLELSPSAKLCSSVSWEQNGYYAAQDLLRSKNLVLHSSRNWVHLFESCFICSRFSNHKYRNFRTSQIWNLTFSHSWKIHRFLNEVNKYWSLKNFGSFNEQIFRDWYQNSHVLSLYSYLKYHIKYPYLSGVVFFFSECNLNT